MPADNGALEGAGESARTAPPRPALRLGVPLLLVAGGVWLLAAGAIFEARSLAEAPWADALLAIGGADAPEGAYPVRVRRAPADNFPPPPAFLEQLGTDSEEAAFLGRLGLGETERIVSIAAPPEVLERLIASGRAPRPGAPEALAGPLARLDAFTVDGVRFEVTGRLRRDVSGLLFAYLAPEDPVHEALFTEAAGGRPGWIHPEGLRLEETLLEETDALDAEEDADAEDYAEPMELAGGRTLASAGLQALGVIGLALVAVGGVLAHTRLFVWIHARYGLRRFPVFHAIAAHPRLWLGVHAGLYGLFFACMFLAFASPLLALRLGEAVAIEFADGSLSYIGDAFASGNVAATTFAIWRHNFITATLFLTFGISIVPFLGVAKTAVSFALVGYVMAPLWQGTLSSYWFHSVTMALELEAYILACFVIIIVTRDLARRLLHQAPVRHVPALLASAIALTGGMLLFAAFYEAATLLAAH